MTVRRRLQVLCQSKEDGAAIGDKGLTRLLDPDSGKELARLKDPNLDGLVHIWDLRKIRRPE
jgi:hypothetical protein